MGDSNRSLRRAARRLCGGLRLAAVLLPAAGAAASPPAPAEILVRLRAEGPHAITDCAEARHRRGERLAGAARDASDSLDRLHAELRVRQVKALFRRSDDRSLAAQRASLRERAVALRSRLPAPARARLPAVPDLGHVYQLRLAAGSDPHAAAARYRADPHVVWAQPNLSTSLDFDADDPFLASSGSWGQPFGDLWGIHRVEAPAAWDHSLGEGVVVAVVDSGVDTEHPDLAANLWLNPGEDLDRNGRVDPAERNGIDDDGNGFIDDFHGFDFANSIDADGDGDFDDPGDVSDADPFDDSGHGTHVAGTVAAVVNNGIGVAGVAPRARIMALKGFQPGSSAPIARLARAMAYASLNGADVINNSWSCSQRCPSNPVAEDAVALANALGVVVVTSAGNRSDDVVFYSPEKGRGTIVAGASDPDDRLTHVTNLGFGIDVVAPGGASPFAAGVPERAILSLLSSGARPGATGNGVFIVGERYLRWAGTSMSSPHVAGIAALILAQRPWLTPDQVRGLIRGAARDLDVPGHDRRTGAGLANAFAAVTRDPPVAGARFESPGQGELLVPGPDPVTIRGALLGDVVAAELSVGFGQDPADFEPIPLRIPPRATLASGGAEALASWEVAALPDGPYVLRLEVEGGDGERVVEFRQVALERNPPTRLSSDGPAARDPVVAGDTVVWQSKRPGDDDEELGLELFAHDWSSGEEWRVAGGPGDQRGARLSGRRLAWLDGDSGIRSCRIRRAGRPCHDRVAVSGREGLGELDLSGRRLVWTERIDIVTRLRGCVWRGRRCHPIALPAEPANQSQPVISGRTLYWLGGSPRLDWLLRCVFDGGRCVPSEVSTQAPPSSFAASGSLVAWSLVTMAPPLIVCRVADDGSCAFDIVAFQSLEHTGFAVSGDRVVWSAPGPGGDPDVYFCEHDRHTGACPVQRLHGSPANQLDPEIAGDRIVWEDDRDGPVAVFGLELPSLAPLADRRTRVGRRLRITVRGHEPTGEPLALTAAFADGTPLSERGAHFRQHRNGTGVLHWRASAEQVGEHVVTFAGTGAGGLVTRRSVKIEVRPQRGH